MNHNHEQKESVTIFIADDVPNNLQVLANILSKENYQIGFAGDGEQALNQIRTILPDLVLLDVMMPRMNGFDVCRQLKKSPETADIPVIFLTAMAESENVVEGFAAGGIDYVTKPFKAAELLARVRTQLELKRNREKLLEVNRLLERDLADASQYVNSLLPTPSVGDKKPRTDYYFKPCRQLGGDFIYYRWLDDDHFMFYLLDVCGHGVGTALLSVSLMTLINGAAQRCENKENPAHILQLVNDDFLTSNPNDLFFSLWYGIYVPSRRELIYSSAGHPPAVLFSGPNADRIVRHSLSTPGMVLGVMPDQRFTNAVFKLQEYNKLFLFSDGVYEVEKDSDGSMWTLQEWRNLLTDNLKENDGDLDAIIRYVCQLGGTDQLADDFSLLKIDF